MIARVLGLVSVACCGRVECVLALFVAARSSFIGRASCLYCCFFCTHGAFPCMRVKFIGFSLAASGTFFAAVFVGCAPVFGDEMVGAVSAHSSACPGCHDASIDCINAPFAAEVSSSSSCVALFAGGHEIVDRVWTALIVWYHVIGFGGWSAFAPMACWVFAQQFLAGLEIGRGDDSTAH